MPWLVGIDEAGYGPNLGPFVMSAVACRAPDERRGRPVADARRRAARREKPPTAASSSMTPRSSTPAARGWPAWSAASSPIFGLPPLTLAELVDAACATAPKTCSPSAWFTGTSTSAARRRRDELAGAARALRRGSAHRRRAWPGWSRSLVGLPGDVQRLVEQAGSKSAVLSYGFIRLLRRRRRGGGRRRGGPRPRRQAGRPKHLRRPDPAGAAARHGAGGRGEARSAATIGSPVWGAS